MAERKTLKTTKVNEPTTHDRKDNKGTFQVMEFLADDGEKKGLKFKSLNPAIFEAIKDSLDGALECDVDYSEREWQGDTITDRRVVQVYKDGQPIAQKGRYGQSYGKSPEQMKEERQSIEGAVALKELGECIRSNTDVSEDLMRMYFDIIRAKLTTFGNGVPSKADKPPVKEAVPKADGAHDAYLKAKNVTRENLQIFAPDKNLDSMAPGEIAKLVREYQEHKAPQKELL